MSAGPDDCNPTPSDGENEVAEAIIDAIERPKKGDLRELGPDGYLPKLDLPGFDSVGEDCGDEIPHFCDHCGKDFEIGRTCARSTCKRCAPAWVLKRAGTSRENSSENGDVPGYVGKIWATAKMMSAARGGESIKKHHVSFMPPMNDWILEADDPYDRTVKVIQEIMDEMDFQGVIFYHPWSGDNVDRDSDDRGEWKKRLFNDRDFEDDVRHELIPRGHFHVVGCSPWIPGGEITKRVHEETGWIIERHAKRDGSGVSLDSMEDVARAVTYCLSHTGIDTSGDHNRAAIRKKGALYQKAKVNQADMDAADHAVRSVAPRTLGVSLDSVKCQKQVAKGEDADHVDNSHLLHDDGDGCGCDDTEPEIEDDVEMTSCNGNVQPIGLAPRFLEDAEWRAEAPHADSLQSTWEDWEEGDGWPGG